MQVTNFNAITFNDILRIFTLSLQNLLNTYYITKTMPEITEKYNKNCKKI